MSEQDTVRTLCGREFEVADLCLNRFTHPAARVSLRTRLLPQDHDELWASFTTTEARRLAAHLLAHADAVEAVFRGQITDPPATRSEP